jgi:hypothetical protein
LSSIFLTCPLLGFSNSIIVITDLLVVPIVVVVIVVGTFYYFLTNSTWRRKKMLTLLASSTYHISILTHVHYDLRDKIQYTDQPRRRGTKRRAPSLLQPLLDLHTHTSLPGN